MIRLIRVELLKIRTTRLAYGLLLTAVGLTTLFSIIEAALSGPGKSVAPLSTAAGLNSVITGTSWALLPAVMGATVSSGEFRHSTATLTYLAAPARDKVLMAKVTAGTIAGAVFSLVGYLIAAAVGLIFAAAHGYHLAVGDPTLIRYGLGHIRRCGGARGSGRASRRRAWPARPARRGAECQARPRRPRSSRRARRPAASRRTR